VPRFERYRATQSFDIECDAFQYAVKRGTKRRACPEKPEPPRKLKADPCICSQQTAEPVVVSDSERYIRRIINDGLGQSPFRAPKRRELVEHIPVLYAGSIVGYNGLRFRK